MNKKIISVVISALLVLSCCIVNADTSSADVISDDIPSVDVTYTTDEENNSSDSAAQTVLADTKDESSEKDDNSSAQVSDEKQQALSAKEVHESHKDSFMKDFDETMQMINQSAIDNEYRCYIDVTIMSKKYYKITERSLNGGLNDEDMICLHNFADGLFDLLTENATRVYTSESEISDFNENYDKVGLVANWDVEKQKIKFGLYILNPGTDTSAKSLKFELNGNYIKCPYGYFYIENPYELIDYVGENYFGEGVLYQLTGSKTDLSYSKYQTQYLDYDNKKYNGESVNILEKLTFDINLNQSHKYTFFDFLGNPGTTVKCRIVQVDRSKADVFVLTMEGSKCTMEFETSAPSNFGYDGTYNFMDFERLRISGTTSGNGVGSVNVRLTSPCDKVIFSSMPVSNMNYEFYYHGNTAAEKRAIYKMFGIEKGDAVISYPQTQDPEYYITKMRNSYELFGETHVTDYDINFVAVMPIEVNSKASPDWYLALGDDVTATILGISHTVNGKESHCYTMIKFTGSKSSIWFDMASGSHRIDWDKTDYTAEDNLEMKLEYDSLLSFDGNEKIQNTLDKEYIDARIYFSHEDFSIKSIEFDIGLITDEVTADEINYIGGGKDIYEKFM